MRVKCPICFEPCFEIDGKDQQVVLTLRCGHIFHQKCIVDWYRNNKSCAICRKKSTLHAAVKLYPQFDEEPTEEEEKLMRTAHELETKIAMLQSEVDHLKSDNRQLKSIVENAKDKYVDYQEFIEDFANDLLKSAKRIDQFRQNMNAQENDTVRTEEVTMRSKATFYTKCARKRSVGQLSSAENASKRRRNE